MSRRDPRLGVLFALCAIGAGCGPALVDGDAGVDAGGAVDAGDAVDAGPRDAGVGDAGAGDAGTGDAGAVDAGTADTGLADTGAQDTGPVDAGPGDAGPSDAPVDPCAVNPCMNGGACSAAVTGFTCMCPAGFSGSLCETNIDDCAPAPCQHLGTCVDGVAGFRCTCVAGYTGDLCQCDDGTGVRVTADFTSMGSSRAPTVTVGPLTASGSADVVLLNLNGIGIAGGAFDDAIDGAESIRFAFATGVASVSYVVSAGGNLDGDGTVADATLEAFAVGGASLGSFAVSDTGTHDLDTLFGAGTTIGSFTVTAAVDNQRIGQVLYRLDPGIPLTRWTLDLAAMATTRTTTITSTHLSVSGSAQLNILALNGLGVVGGVFDDAIDGSESVTLTFDQPMHSVSYEVSAGGNLDADGTVADATLEAFDQSGASLGVLDVSDTGAHDVSALAASSHITRVVVTAAIDNQRIGSIDYAACMPTP